jgi:hypothetical protein
MALPKTLDEVRRLVSKRIGERPEAELPTTREELEQLIDERIAAAFKRAGASSLGGRW